jgi:outer membrane lipoprotein-sorting protein
MTSALLGALLASAAAAQEPKASDIVRAAVDYWRGLSSFSEAVVTIHRKDWERSMTVRVWTKGEKESLVRVTAPPKDEGNGTLVVKDGMWTFNPKVRRVVKIPASFMSQSWMGSDFSNNDLAKADELVEKYTHRLLGRQAGEGREVFVIESVPKESAPVVWGREVVKIRDDHVILEHAFYDQAGALVKTLRTERIEVMGGKPIASSQRMIRAEGKEEWTRVETLKARFGLDLPAFLFTLANLSEPREKP